MYSKKFVNKQNLYTFEFEITEGGKIEFVSILSQIKNLMIDPAYIIKWTESVDYLGDYESFLYDANLENVECFIRVNSFFEKEFEKVIFEMIISKEEGLKIISEKSMDRRV